MNVTQLAGVSDHAIAEDYSLTRVGREPARAKVMERLTKEPLFASNNEAALNMFTSRCVSLVSLMPYSNLSSVSFLQIGNHARILTTP